MDETSESLSGRWLGRYEYDRWGAPCAFEADVTEEAGLISGQTHEPNSFQVDGGAVLTATITGTRIAADVSFTKEYQGFQQGGPLVYNGLVNVALTRIEGRWHFANQPALSGRFVMMRKPRAAARAARSAEIERELAFTIPQ